MPEYKNPIPTVDIVIFDFQHQLVLIKRKNPPHGWALPGGFVNEGESFEDAARREAKEETSLDVTLVEQFHTYSSPTRDPRKHITSTVYIARVNSLEGLKAADDAAEVEVVPLTDAIWRDDLAFDHKKILLNVFTWMRHGVRPAL